MNVIDKGIMNVVSEKKKMQKGNEIVKNPKHNVVLQNQDIFSAQSYCDITPYIVS